MSNLNAAPIVFANVASTSQQGVVQLAGDLAGTSTAPLVKKLNGVALPAGTGTAGQTLIVQNDGTLAYGTVVKRVVTPTFASSLTPNADTTDIYRPTLTGNVSFVTPSGTPVAGQLLQFSITQDSTGSRTGTFDSGYVFSTDIPVPTLSTAANKLDIILFQYDAVATKWRCVGVIKGY